MGSQFAGFYIVIFFASNVSLAMYAISFAQYLQGVLPQVPIVPVAVACLTIFFITNLLGIEGAAKLEERVMDIVLALAMTCFIDVRTAQGGLQHPVYSGLCPRRPHGHHHLRCAADLGHRRRHLTWST